MAISFGGAQISRPGSYSQVDTSSMTVSSTGSFRSLAFIGLAPALVAGTDVSKPLVFGAQNVKDAATTLGAGDLLTHMNAAWKHGADLIYVSVIKPAAQTPTDAEWQAGVDALNKLFVDGVVLVNATAAIIAKVHTHCVNMSSVLNRKERRGFYGHPKGTAVAAIQTLLTSANTERALWASPAVFDYDASGAKVLYDSTLLAAAMAGLWASKNPQDPITYDYVQFAGLETAYEATDINTLLTAGVAVVEQSRRGFRIVQGRTADTSTDVSKNELSVSTLKDTMSIDMRDYLADKFVGQAGIAGIETSVYNAAMSRIKQEYLQTQKYITSYVDGSLKVVKNGTAFSVDWEGKPTLPVNNFLITSHFTL